MEPKVLRSFEYGDGDSVVKVVVYSFPLQLRAAFGTSHSSTTVRTNALFKVQVGTFCGEGEVGLPPKKAHVYLSDLDDVIAFADAVKAKLASLSEQEKEEADEYDPFQELPPRFFAGLRIKNRLNCSLHSSDGLSSETENEVRSGAERGVRRLFSCMDSLPDRPAWRAPASGLESALLVLWARLYSCALYEMIGFDVPAVRPSFYTVAMNEDEAELVEGATFGMQFTPHIKVKLNADFGRGKRVLDLVTSMAAERQAPAGYRLAVDANAAWTPALAREFLGLLEGYLPHVYAVEQPYDVQVTDREEWAAVVVEYAAKGIRVIADESMCVLDDVAKLDGVATCVNLKLEKTGGIRNALRCADEAERRGMHVWIGIMVCSILGSSTAAQLLSCSSFGGDVDGGLLVEAGHQAHLVKGGFRWGQGKDLGNVLWDIGSTIGVGCDVLVGEQ